MRTAVTFQVSSVFVCDASIPNRWSTTAMGDIPREHRMFPHFCVVQINNVLNNPQERGGTRWIAYPRPHVIFQYHDAKTGALRYAESIHAKN